jgi:hypothetical protein
MSPAARRIAAALLTAAALAACDPSSLGSSTPTHCVEVAAQCQLEAGPLGVCERTECAAGEVPPCFVCTPQH